MIEDERIDTFLTKFKELEKELLAIAKLKDDYVSFSRALNHIYYNRLNPIIADRDVYDFLKTASDLRNILSHENDVCIPSEKFLNKFIKIATSIISPYSCYDVCTKDVAYASLGMRIKDVMKIMEDDLLTHLPILDNEKRVVGVFSRSSFFDLVKNNPSLTIDEELTVYDFQAVIGLDDHLNESFYFVSKNMNIRRAFEMIIKKKAHDKIVGLLLVTENGKKDEALLGVITLTDLAKLQLDS